MKSSVRFAVISICISLFCSVNLAAQNPGDTIVVSSFDYNSTTRDTTITFPDFDGVTYRKILMQYNMRCHDAAVNTTGGNGIACGEWDYSCNTYLHDTTRVDSLKRTTPHYNFSGFSGSTLNYTSNPTYTVQQSIQNEVVVNSITSETQAIVGTGSDALTQVLPTVMPNAKSTYLYTADELTTAGLTAGDIAGLLVDITTAAPNANFLRVKLKETSAATLDASAPDYTNWTEVYNLNTALSTGSNRLQFDTPFTWDGTSNVAVELSYHNNTPEENTEVTGHTTTETMGLTAPQDPNFVFNGDNYLEASDYKGIAGSGSRTIEAWIRTTVPDKEIVSWGTDAHGEKWVFRLDATGAVRVEVNGGYKFGVTNVADGNWHHVACVLSGSTVNYISLYVDGQVESVGGVQSIAVNTNIDNGINIRVSRGINNRYFDGDIDEVRIWNTALTQTILSNWMYRELDATHPNADNLVAEFAMSENGGSTVADISGNGHNLEAVNGALWNDKTGTTLFKDLSNSTNRPNLTLVQGVYDTTINENTVNDTLFNAPTTLTEYAVVSHAGTNMSDEIAVLSAINVWDASVDNLVIDPDGNTISTTSVEADGTATIDDLEYWTRNNSKIELMSFVTPYGVYLDLGPNGKTWTFDMTDYTPILKGQKRITVERGGEWQEELDVKFLFIVGTPPRDVLDMRQIWRVDGPSYASIADNSYYPPVDEPTMANGESFKIRSAITGHGQNGEFIPRQHYIKINGNDAFSWQVWKACAENPIFPQGGTWIYDRAGWCPGMATDVKEWDVTSYITPGDPVNIEYSMQAATGDSRYIANHQFITYGAANFALDAGIMDIERPSTRVEFSREGPSCSQPLIVIQNLGSDPLTSATIEYWVNDATTPSTYSWTGNLAMMESQEVALPITDELWSSIVPSGNVFRAHITAPNGSADENNLNDSYNSPFRIPPVLPSDFIIVFKTNSYANENHYEVVDDNDNVIFSRNNMSNNTVYSDTLNLATGCYSYKVYDNDGDGIDFWANSDGAGYTRIKSLSGSTLYNLEADFGGSLQFPFTVNYPLSYEDVHPETTFSVYPNPTRNKFKVNFTGFDHQVDIMIYNSVGKRVLAERLDTSGSNYKGEFDLSDFKPGVYLIRINDGTRTATEKIVKN